MSISDRATADFFIMPFAIDGESVGIDFWEISNLAPHWLEICKNHLTSAGPVFDTSLAEKLSHIRLKCSSASDAALMTFLVEEKIASSVILLSGQSSAADAEVAQMFVTSLRQSEPVRLAAATSDPFEQLLVAKERPLMAVVHWPDDTVDGDDGELVRELGLHFAGAFFGLV
jgi:hypothetical protein